MALWGELAFVGTTSPGQGGMRLQRKWRERSGCQRHQRPERQPALTTSAMIGPETGAERSRSVPQRVPVRQPVLQAAQVKAAVYVDDLAGGVVEIAIRDGSHG